MKYRKIVYSLIICLFILTLILGAVVFYSNSKELKVIFLDVGQGDAILIEQGNQQILIDGGPSGQTLLNKLGKYVPFWDRKIELVVATHPDADHITGLVQVMQNYKVDVVMKTEASSDSQVFKKYQEVIRERNIFTVGAQRGEKIILGGNAQLEILSPGSETLIDAQDTNASSIVARLFFGENSFLFTGDLPSEQEAVLIDKNINLNSRVLKVAHHGSGYSTSAEFLDKVDPEDAVISVGKKNRYGHPNPEILDRLRQKSINVWRTDETGDTIYICPMNKICQLN